MIPNEDASRLLKVLEARVAREHRLAVVLASEFTKAECGEIFDALIDATANGHDHLAVKSLQHAAGVAWAMQVVTDRGEIT